MAKKRNFLIIGITIILYTINQIIKSKIPINAIRWFMSCYFNDTIGGMTFSAYYNTVLAFRGKQMSKLWQIELLLFFAGLFWEYVTPIFRANTVSDICDVLAYMIGGVLYWLIIRKGQNAHKQEC